MNKFTQEVPAMYGDHHVTEVKRILQEINGVEDIYASSAFRVVEVSYDPSKVTEEVIKTRLEEAGYLGGLSIPVEVGAAVVSESLPSNGKTYMRHTAVYEQTQHAVSFGQNVSYLGRPLWPCPGMGTLKNIEE